MHDAFKAAGLKVVEYLAVIKAGMQRKLKRISMAILL